MRLVDLDLHEFEDDIVVYRGAHYGDPMADCAARAAVLSAAEAFIPGYLTDTCFTTRIDLATPDREQAAARAEAFALEMCGPAPIAGFV
ncbi:hypothetical protein RNZ50_23955 [Paracoccaceae bacterium Fryx2]|nr:hypothetical protein [Paracoccaceae bacterium Fryx2]